ncbi:MAG: LysR family transcriptional regulator [Betaproteobacteria bacterium]|nr:LysR family transcriptional regulator [Betaproteobacteria bacterium]
MTLKHLEALYWVWRLGSFTAAAERLHSTQSAISMRIRDLEEALGQELFDRTARAARLTTKGQELVGYAERVMELMAEIKARIGDPTIVSGIVRIGVTEYVALTWLPDLVRELNARFPRVTLEMNVDLTLSLLDKLSGGEIDLAMLPGPIVQPGLRNISLGFVEFAWMASPALKIPDRPLTPRDLDNWPILTLSKTSNLYAQLERWFEESGAVGRRTDTCNSLSVLASWTISGLGIGYLPIEHFGRDIRAGRLRMVDVTPKLPDLEYVAALDRRHPQPLAQSVAELAVTVSTFERRTQLPETQSGKALAAVAARRKPAAKARAR